GPGGVGYLAVAAHGHHVHAVGAALERSEHLGRDADRVPLADVLDLVAEPHAAGAARDHVRLLLLAVLMRDRVAHVRAVPEQAHADVARLQVLPAHPDLEAVHAPGGRVVHVEQVDDRKVAHGLDGSDGHTPASADVPPRPVAERTGVGPLAADGSTDLLG